MQPAQVAVRILHLFAGRLFEINAKPGYSSILGRYPQTMSYGLPRSALPNE